MQHTRIPKHHTHVQQMMKQSPAHNSHPSIWWLWLSRAIIPVLCHWLSGLCVCVCTHAWVHFHVVINKVPGNSDRHTCFTSEFPASFRRWNFSSFRCKVSLGLAWPSFPPRIWPKYEETQPQKLNNADYLHGPLCYSGPKMQHTHTCTNECTHAHMHTHTITFSLLK